MRESSDKNKIIRNIIWKLAERTAALIVSFSVTAVLARILEPEDFGIVEMITIFVTFSTIFVTSGLGNALIQKEKADGLDFSTMFWANLMISVIIYTILFLGAPGIANFYGYTQLCVMLRVLSISIIIAAVNSIQTAYISRCMMFRFYFYSTITGKVASGILGVGVALSGGGAWALVIQSLSLICFETLVLWFKAGWRPQKKFSIERAKQLYSFAWRVMLSSIIVSLNEQFRGMVIGKKYAASDLAYYNKGQLLPNTMATNVLNSLSAVMFPVLSQSQGNIDQLRGIFRKWISLSSYIMFPLLSGAVITSESIVKILLSEKWIFAVPYMELACLVYATRCIEIPIREMLKAVGRADIFLKMQVIKTIIAVLSLILVMQYGVLWIAMASAACALINIAISIYYAGKYIDYKINMLFKDVNKTVCSCIAMGAMVSLVSGVSTATVIKLGLQVFTGIVTFILVSAILKSDEFQYCVNALYKKRKANRKEKR